MILSLVERFDGEGREREPAGLADERLQDADDAGVVTVIEADFSDGQIAEFCLPDYGLGERMAEPVEVGLAGPTRKFIEAERNVAGKGRGAETEAAVAEKLGVAVEFVAGELDEQALKAIEVGF